MSLHLIHHFSRTADRQLADKIDELSAKANRELGALRAHLEKKATEALQLCEKQEREVAQAKLEEVEKCHAHEVTRLKAETVARDKIIETHKEEMETIQLKCEEIYDELLKVQGDYQDFVDRHPLFDPGQTNYLLPDFVEMSNVENPYNRRKIRPQTSL